jgi:hypothetical protein
MTVAPVRMPVHVEFPARDSLPRFTLEVQMNLIPQAQRSHGLLKNLFPHPHIPQSAHHHVAADS